MSDDLFEFTDSPQNSLSQGPSWKVLSVEDNPEYQASLLLALARCRVMDQPLQVLTAGSAIEAAPKIAANPDIAVILLDVVMEEDDSGLRLVRTIRDIIGNSAVRIVLLTGQPGMAPCKDIMLDYDIDEYWCKSDLGNDQLLGVVASNIRTWDYISRLTKAKHGLQLVVDASRSLSDKRDLHSFAQTVLEEISRIVDIQKQGILCAECRTEEGLGQCTVIASSDKFKTSNGRLIAEVLNSPQMQAFAAALHEGCHIFEENFSVLYFSNKEESDRVFLTLVDTAKPLNDEHINLLKVFSENISSGFINLFLYNRLTEMSYQDSRLGIHNRNWLCMELNNMSRMEKAAMKITLAEIADYAHMGITFGEGFCDQLMESLYHHLLALYPQARCICRFNSNTLAIVGTAAECNDVASRATDEQALMVAGVSHSVPITTVDFLLQDMSDWEAEQILRLAKCGVEQARRKQLRYASFDTSLSTEISDRMALLDRLRSALTDNELYIVLQPKVALKDRRVVGFEALVRWQTKEGKQFSPGEFIPLAEASGLIGQLDRQVLKLTCEAIHRLNDEGIFLPVAFNASPTELLVTDYFDKLMQVVDASHVDPSLLELEITETQAMLDYKEIGPKLRHIMALGMKVSIDDFGTGYSSLSHVAQLAATTLKIDRAFVSRLGHSSDGEHIVDMILKLGERFGYSIVAEGIETEEQCQYLVNKDCHVGQGFWFAKPMKVEPLLQWLKGKAISASQPEQTML